METHTLPAGKKRRILLWIYGAALLYFVLKQVYFAVWVGGFPDQLGHFSYLAWLSDHPTFLPDFRALPNVPYICAWVAKAGFAIS